MIARAGLEFTGEDYVGHRMSGQEVRAPLVRVPRLELGDQVLTDVVAGAWEYGETSGEDGFDGILGLDLLGDLPLTVDPFACVITLGARASAVKDGITVPARLNRDGPAVDMHVGIRLPDGQLIEVEVDTGSGSTILDTRFMPGCHLDGQEEDARIEEGTDETGHRFLRRFVSIAGALSLASAPETTDERPTVMFQDIELDGLIGTDFLDRYVQTYDTRNGTITLRLPDAQAGATPS